MRLNKIIEAISNGNALSYHTNKLNQIINDDYCTQLKSKGWEHHPFDIHIMTNSRHPNDSIKLETSESGKITRIIHTRHPTNSVSYNVNIHNSPDDLYRELK
jgi:hypothetical protein